MSLLKWCMRIDNRVNRRRINEGNAHIVKVNNVWVRVETQQVVDLEQINYADWRDKVRDNEKLQKDIGEKDEN